MTPSIIRRLLNYHGIVGAIHWTIDDAIAALVKRRCMIIPNEREVIAALTRIEDAELLQQRVAGLSAPLLDYNAEAQAVREFYTIDMRRLFAMANIDPERWAKVTE